MKVNNGFHSSEEVADALTIPEVLLVCHNREEQMIDKLGLRGHLTSGKTTVGAVALNEDHCIIA